MFPRLIALYHWFMRNSYKRKKSLPLTLLSRKRFKWNTIEKVVMAWHVFHSKSRHTIYLVHVSGVFREHWCRGHHGWELTFDPGSYLDHHPALPDPGDWNRSGMYVWHQPNSWGSSDKCFFLIQDMTIFEMSTMLALLFT